MTTLFAIIITIVCTGYAVYILDSKVKLLHLEWENLEEEKERYEEPAKSYPALMKLIIFAVAVLAVLPVWLGWHWIIPAIGAVALCIVQLVYTNDTDDVSATFWYTASFAASFGFCMHPSNFFQWVAYTFIALAVVFVTRLVRESILEKKEVDDDE